MGSLASNASEWRIFEVMQNFCSQKIATLPKAAISAYDNILSEK